MKPGMAWPIGMVALLVATVAGNLVVMRIASDDPSFAVEPDYYRKAVHYDSTMAQARENLALGWAVATAMAPIGDGTRTELRVGLRDAAGAPLAGARVAIMTRFNARANDTLTAVLEERTPGQYTTHLPIARPGEWEVRVDATRDGHRFSASQRVTAVRAVAAAPAPTEGRPE